MEIGELTAYLNNSAKIADLFIFDAVNSFISLSKEDLREKAPVDKGDYREGWEHDGPRRIDSGIEGSLFNKVSYGPDIELGSSVGQKPWPNPGMKTVRSNGRIFSSQAVGGTIDKVFSKAKINNFVADISKAITGSFK